MTYTNIDHMDAIEMLSDAYNLLFEFQQTIWNMENDHPCAEEVEAWLSQYEDYTKDTEAA